MNNEKLVYKLYRKVIQTIYPTFLDDLKIKIIKTN